MVKEQLELLRRRIFVAKAERVDVSQLELEFAETKAKLDALVQHITAQELPEQDMATPAGPPPASKPRPKPTGRRNLADEDLPEERVEILDPAKEGETERIGFEESSKLRYRRGGFVRLVVARATYKDKHPPTPEHPVSEASFTLYTVPMPKELFPRGILAPSMIAHILVQKYRWGLPFHRQSRMYAAEGCKLDDGTMCRYGEDAGATLGCIVDAMAGEARATAFCLSTDATGICIQPERLPGRKRQACRKGHFFAVLADQDHVFFEYQTQHTSAAVCEMFRGFSGYIQADAHAIYDAVFRGEARAGPDDDAPTEVGCWSHCRRKAWEAAVVAKEPVAREALLRIRKLFDFEAEWIDLPGSFSARTIMPPRPPTSCRSSRPASCTSSTPRLTSPRSSTSCHTGRGTDTSSSRPSTGPLRVPASPPRSSRSKSAMSRFLLFPRRSRRLRADRGSTPNSFGHAARLVEDGVRAGRTRT